MSALYNVHQTACAQVDLKDAMHNQCTWTSAECILCTGYYCALVTTLCQVELPWQCSLHCTGHFTLELPWQCTVH